tara:strand:+ start:80 stop:715 length:636 start_codon:yes stop_codon:yes gene_type:complete
MINFLYKIIRILLYPIILLADFLQNNLTSKFTPMNMGPVSEDSYSSYIKNNINKKYYVLDFGSGAGYFSSLFNPKKYLGVEINKNFVNFSRKNKPNYKFRILKNNYLQNFEKKINLIFINNVLHHLTDKQISETFLFFKKKLNRKTKVFIIEPLFPKTFPSLEFFLKVLDIGNNIKTKKNYLKLFKRLFKIENYNVRKVGIGSVLIIKGHI